MVFDVDNYYLTILCVSGLAYAVYWYLVYKDIRYNALNFLELMLKILFMTPLWLLFFAHVINFCNLKIEWIYNPPIKTQKITIKNDSKDDAKFIVYQRNVLKKQWEPAFNYPGYKTSNHFKLKNREEKDYFIRVDWVGANKVYIINKRDTKLPDSMTTALAFEIPNDRISLYTHDWDGKSLKKLKISYNREFYEIALFLLFISALYYQYNMIHNVRKKTYWLIGSSVVTFILTIQIYFDLQILTKIYLL